MHAPYTGRCRGARLPKSSLRLEGFEADFREIRVGLFVRAFALVSCCVVLAPFVALPALEEYLDRSAIRTSSPEGLIAAYATGISRLRRGATW